MKEQHPPKNVGGRNQFVRGFQTSIPGAAKNQDPDANANEITHHPYAYGRIRRSFDSDEWEFIHNEFRNEDHGGRIEPLPSNHFHGTWEGAYNDASKAGKEVAHASLSYVEAIAQSSVSKASRSVGAALANTANRHALSAAKYAVDASGANRNRLPYGFRSWLRGKDKIDEAKQRAKEAEYARMQRKIKAELIASGQVIEARPTPGQSTQAYSRVSSPAEPRTHDSFGFESCSLYAGVPVPRLSAPSLGIEVETENVAEFKEEDSNIEVAGHDAECEADYDAEGDDEDGKAEKDETGVEVEEVVVCN